VTSPAVSQATPGTILSCFARHHHSTNTPTLETLSHTTTGASPGSQVVMPGGTTLAVHDTCALWAPAAYEDADAPGGWANLEKEVARGAKVKCGACGKPGAALGCKRARWVVKGMDGGGLWRWRGKGRGLREEEWVEVGQPGCCAAVGLPVQ
jgi:hypothetical protein